MSKEIYRSVLSAYEMEENLLKMESFGSGLINTTWKISTTEGEYILQKINHAIFKRPKDIAHNIHLIDSYIRRKYPTYRFIGPVSAKDGETVVYEKGLGYFRLFPFVSGSHSLEIVRTPHQAYEAAAQFGRFTRLLSGFDVQQLRTTIPAFHDLNLRYQQFLESIKNGSSKRLKTSESLIKILMSNKNIVDDFDKIRSSPEFKLRVTHHDTKISNVLFDKNDKGQCVIDLDTVMPGYFISDVGDMMRTYLSPVSEEVDDFTKIDVRKDFYKAIVQGYYSEMKDVLTEAEKESFFYAGKFMIYMQAIRFLTDYLNDDIYYGASYPEHNFIRASNQAVLLRQLIGKETELAQLTVETGFL